MKTNRDRAMDGLTILVLLAAVGFYWRSTSAKASGGGETAQQSETALLSARPDTLRVTNGVDSVTQLIDFRSDSGTVLVFFTTTCPWCKKTKPEWERVASKLPASVRMIALTIESVSPDVKTYFASPQIRTAQPSSVAQISAMFPVGVVPVTMAVRNGRVLAAHVGLASGTDVDHVVAALVAKK